MDVVIRGFAGPESQLLLSMRKRLAETLGPKLFARRSRLEKFAEHQLVTAHSCLAIHDTLHLPALTFSAPAISFGPVDPIVISRLWSPSSNIRPVGTVVCAASKSTKRVEHLEGAV
jgi:hypothetical protein